MSEARLVFRKSHRLLSSREFRYVFQRAWKRSSGGLSVYVRRTDLGHPRLGIAVSRRCAPAAKDRNRIKRVIREGFRLRQHGLGSVDIVFLGRPGLAGKNKKELRAIVDKHLTEIERCDRF